MTYNQEYQPKLVDLFNDFSYSPSKPDEISITQKGSSTGPKGTLSVVDGGITSVKLADDSVITTKIDELAVTLSKLAPDSVDATKIRSRSVGWDEIAPHVINSDLIEVEGIDTESYADASVTKVKLGTDIFPVTSEDIADGAVIRGKLGNGAVSRQSIELGAVDTDQLDDSAVTSLKIAPATIKSYHMAVNSVNQISLQPGCVTLEKMAVDSVDATKIKSRSVGYDEIAPNVINSDLIEVEGIDTESYADNSVTTDKLDNGAVTNAKLAVGAVGTSNLQNGSVTRAKLSNVLPLAPSDLKFDPYHSNMGKLTNVYDSGQLVCKVLDAVGDNGEAIYVPLFWERVGNTITYTIDQFFRKFNFNTSEVMRLQITSYDGGLQDTCDKRNIFRYHRAYSQVLIYGDLNNIYHLGNVLFDRYSNTIHIYYDNSQPGKFPTFILRPWYWPLTFTVNSFTPDFGNSHWNGQFWLDCTDEDTMNIAVDRTFILSMKDKIGGITADGIVATKIQGGLINGLHFTQDPVYGAYTILSVPGFPSSSYFTLVITVIPQDNLGNNIAVTKNTPAITLLSGAGTNSTFVGLGQYSGVIADETVGIVKTGDNRNDIYVKDEWYQANGDNSVTFIISCKPGRQKISTIQNSVLTEDADSETVSTYGDNTYMEIIGVDTIGQHAGGGPSGFNGILKEILLLQYVHDDEIKMKILTNYIKRKYNPETGRYGN